MAVMRRVVAAALLASVASASLADTVTSVQQSLFGASDTAAAAVNETVAAEFDNAEVSVSLGDGKIDVGVDSHEWNCAADTVAYTGNAFLRHNPNAGVGILKASHCRASCQQDTSCAAFVYFAKGNTNVTMHNPAGLQPGSCWKYSNKVWPQTSKLAGFITCWNPNVTKAVAPAASAAAAAPVAAATTTAPVTESSVAATTTLLPLLTLAPTSTTVNITATSGGEESGGMFGNMWVVGLGLLGLAVIGAIVAAVCCGACGGGDKPKKKKKTKRASKTSADETSTASVPENEPFIPADRAAAVAAPVVYAAPQTYAAPVATYTTPMAQYAQYPGPAMASQVMMAPAVATQQYAGSYVQMAQPAPVVYAAGQSIATSADVFNMMDRNHDGVLTRSEFNQVVR